MSEIEQLPSRAEPVVKSPRRVAVILRMSQEQRAKYNRICADRQQSQSALFVAAVDQMEEPE